MHLEVTAMNEITIQQTAGLYLKKLIHENYDSQEDFAYDFGTDIRTVSRYVNNGINKISTIQELADFFGIRFQDFFS
jgi:transcriptional regulator with XRE-family HTH domain